MGKYIKDVKVIYTEIATSRLPMYEYESNLSDAENYLNQFGFELKWIEDANAVSETNVIFAKL